MAGFAPNLDRADGQDATATANGEDSDSDAGDGGQARVEHRGGRGRGGAGGAGGSGTASAAALLVRIPPSEDVACAATKLSLRHSWRHTPLFTPCGPLLRPQARAERAERSAARASDRLRALERTSAADAARIRDLQARLAARERELARLRSALTAVQAAAVSALGVEVALGGQQRGRRGFLGLPKVGPVPCSIM